MRGTIRVKNFIHSALPAAMACAFLICCAPSAFAAGMYITGGKGTFVLQGSGFEQISGVNVTITYDRGTLSNPRVTQGSLMSDAMMAANTRDPGIIRLALITTNGKSGSGPVASITFDVIRPSGSVPSLTLQELINANNSRVAADSSGQQGDPASGKEDSSSTSDGAAGNNPPPQQPVRTPYLTGLNDIRMPGEEQGAKEKKPEEQQGSVAEPAKTAGKPAAAVPETVEDLQGTQTVQTKPSEKKFVRVDDVMDRFRVFTGEKTPQAFIKLFTSGAEGFRQEPPIAVTDGSTTVRLFIASVNEARNFVLRGAELLSISKGVDNAWEVDALPTKGGQEATVTILQQGLTTEIPLTIVPPLPAESKIGEKGKLTEADFNLFLKERGTEKAPRFDLNGDGKRDYMDDYIFTAHYIMKNKAQVAAATTKQH